MTQPKWPTLRVIAPQKWPPVPEWYSFWWLVDVERCPRRAALRKAEYKDIWSREGYPPRPNSSAILGHVVHLTLNCIISALRDRGINALSDPRAVALLRELGGLSAIVSKIIETCVVDISTNPRVRNLEDFRQQLLQQMPRTRERIQLLLASRTWNSERPIAGKVSHATRGPLKPGVHFEVVLKSLPLRWKGIADLIELEVDRLEITDFKSGTHSDLHADQLRAYALLWIDDEELNPLRRLPTALTLSYVDEEVPVPVPTSTDFRLLRDNLVERTKYANEAFVTQPPPAHIGYESCSECDVRHLCCDYWNVANRAKLITDWPKDFDDIEIELTERLGERTWKAKCKVATHIPREQTIVCRVGNDSISLPSDLQRGAVLRLVNALIARPDDESNAFVATCLATTEIAVV